MKKYFVLLFFCVFIFSCKKDTCPFSESIATATAGEITAIQQYLADSSLTAEQHSSGLFYHITNPGSGATPGLCSYVTVKYTGKLTNGNVFDSNNSGVTFLLGNLIFGWQKGIPLIKPGGKIILYVPPTLGYGNRVVGSIPANSMLIFDIELVNVQ